MILPQTVQKRPLADAPVEEKDRWLVAKKGIIYPATGEITDKEWLSIAEYPPFVKYSEYLQLRKKSEEELIEMLPGGRVWENASRENILFFLTRGFLPDLPAMSKFLERHENFQKLESPFIRDLLFELYSIPMEDPDADQKFLEIYEVHPLETLIFQYYRFMDDRDALLSLLVEIDVEYPGMITSGVDVFTFVYYALKRKIEDSK